MEKISKEDTLKMFDHTNRLYVRITLNESKKYWERWVSKNKRKWELTGKLKTLDDVLKSQQDLVNNNYQNLFKMITNRK